MKKKNSVFKVILTDIAGVTCLILVPILGPLPGPGGTPLLLAGLGLLAINHDWADNMIHFVKVNSESLERLIFPNITWIKWAWDIVAVSILSFGVFLNVVAEWWLVSALSYGIMAGSTTIFMLNRRRLAWFDSLLKRRGKK